MSPLAAALWLAACAPEEPGPPEWPYDLPAGFPAPPLPADNPITDEKVELGRYLFYDRRLSGNGDQACGDCHEQERAFSDGRALPEGSTGDTIPRNAMALPNAAWWSTYTWMNPTITTLEDQALVPMFAEHPTELGMSASMDVILERLRADAAYPGRFAAAFPRDADPFTVRRIVQAIASFERTLISGNSAYDRYWYGGDDGAMTDQQKEGMDLFFSERAECYHCHAGPLLSTAFVSADQPDAEPSFINTGVYNVGGTGRYPEPNTGLYAFTDSLADMGRFRVPTLRNVAVSGPYFHDGSAATLLDVVEHYVEGGRTITEGDAAGAGVDNPYKHPLVRPFDATDDEKAALVAFMEALTDEDFLTDPRFASPFAE
ncbi:MAG TPA: di-heme enzyme [Myxococcota bacterium]|nr:di-heme enzyme [Myxococcota bacterium]